MLDMISYLIGVIRGLKDGKAHVIIESDNYEFTDSSSDGNVVITEVS